MTDINRVKDTIKKLLNLAENESAADGEIANAMRFASRLMEKHHLTEEDISKVDEKLLDLERAEFTKQSMVCGATSVSAWEGWAARFACKLVGGVGCYLSNKNQQRENGILKLGPNGRPLLRGEIHFYGVDEDVEIARQVFGEVTMTVASMSRLRFGGVYRGAGRSYCEGFVTSLLEKLEADNTKQISQNSTGTALVEVRARNQLTEKKTQLAKEWLRGQGIYLSAGRANRSNNHYDGAYGMGRADGQNYNASATRRKKIAAQ